MIRLPALGIPIFGSWIQDIHLKRSSFERDFPRHCPRPGWDPSGGDHPALLPRPGALAVEGGAPDPVALGRVDGEHVGIAADHGAPSPEGAGRRVPGHLLLTGMEIRRNLAVSACHRR